MHVTWIFTGEDGRSHFEDLEVPFAPTADTDAGTAQLSAAVAATSLVFRQSHEGGPRQFHRAPRRQFVVVLSGVMEVECGDGTTRRLGAGEILVADDTTGEGHLTRDLGGPRQSLAIACPEFDPAPWRCSGR